MRWRPVVLPVTLLGCGLLLSGCVIPNIVAATTTSASNAAKTSGTQVDQAQIDQFQKGVTTVSEVQAKLGQPQQTVHNPDGSLGLIYTSRNATGNAQSHVAYARWLGGAETTITTRNVTFVFDSRGKLADTNTTESSLTCKFGHCPG
jgi:outer membrane protein assembly factor BamE (lipoprotein component of BamABCDE complex)